MEQKQDNKKFRSKVCLEIFLFVPVFVSFERKHPKNRSKILTDSLMKHPGRCLSLSLSLSLCFSFCVDTFTHKHTFMSLSLHIGVTTQSTMAKHTSSLYSTLLLDTNTHTHSHTHTCAHLCLILSLSLSLSLSRSFTHPYSR